MAYVLVGPDSCAPCCWRSTTTCPDTLRIFMPLDGIPVGVGSIQISVRFNGGNIAGDCLTDSYVTTSFSPGVSRTFFVDVWRALRDGAWSSSTTVIIYSRQTAPFNTIDYGPTNDSSGSCTTTGYIYPVTAIGTCGAPPTPVATITIMDDGTVSIA